MEAAKKLMGPRGCRFPPLAESASYTNVILLEVHFTRMSFVSMASTLLPHAAIKNLPKQKNSLKSLQFFPLPFL